MRVEFRPSAGTSWRHGAFQAASGGVDAHAFFTQHQGRLGRPDDVARAVTHLAEDAGDWVTGLTYVLDGGFTASPM